MYEIRLYVTGRTTSKSVKAVSRLKALLEQEFKDQYSLEIIDVLENPQAAESDKILATPTVVKVLPQPTRKIIGDLSDREKVLTGLSIGKLT